ncbi:MAG: TolC family protein, partial [Candidatus Omnitrophica bacterium]|nr:TolC family protein [Candidatus Omnitrophota bacterium]
MKTEQIFFVIGAALVLGGCGTVSSYKQPALPVPSTLPAGAAYTQPKAAQPALTAADISWQKVFPDAKLQKLIQLALANNRDLRLAALNVERSRNLYGVQRAELMPAVSATGAGSRQHLPADLS